MSLYPYSFQIKNLTTSCTMTLIPDPWNPLGVAGPGGSGYPALTIAPGGTANATASGSGAYVYYNISGPAGSYPRLQIRWFGVPSTGAALPGGPSGWWDGSPIPSDIYYDETDRVTDHIIYLRDTTPSKIKRGLLKAGTPTPVEETMAIKRSEEFSNKMRAEERAKREASGSEQEKREAKPLGRRGRV
ncbi:hypothetical protein TWF730_002546 [Orbilia blumenaviensis]|uniref:Uncharacterized protein n=1 Tax=Orbilia blumenaviensis TaxID=1796055 RepID=A0AAV9UAG5_9PEZI